MQENTVQEVLHFLLPYQLENQVENKDLSTTGLEFSHNSLCNTSQAFRLNLQIPNCDNYVGVTVGAYF